MESRWKIFINAKNKQKASRVINNLLNKLCLKYSNLGIAAYHKGGFTSSFNHPVDSDPWPEAVIKILAKAQLVGRSWILSGDIETGLDAWSNDSLIPGVKSIHLILDS